MSSSDETNSKPVTDLSDNMKKELDDLFEQIASPESAAAARRIFVISEEDLNKAYKPDDY